MLFFHVRVFMTLFDEFKISAFHRLSFVLFFIITGIVSWFPSPSGENAVHGVVASRLGKTVSTPNEEVETFAEEPFVETISRLAE